ncbi:MAG: hypothetical protein Q8922_11725 [Bacteroidota bacterium]|nr:hypothetical protein [Bacteroidota bacterium]MDP4243814.1 hypothetical protein [Bacteroidota bacterium]MDP4288595.1 hypothetical protein [Bacteroidota bacterium]
MSSFTPDLVLGQVDLLAGKHAAIGKSADKLFAPTRVSERQLFSFDIARTVKLMDATPDASHWYVVDDFAHWQQITIDSQRVEHPFHEIPKSGIRLSPKGDYVIWTGLMRGFTHLGFDSTTVYLYKDMAPIGHYVADFPAIEFSRSGDRWAVLLPYAYEMQTGDRDFVIVDGLLAHKGEVYPHQFSFSHDEKHWAYRATDGLIEKLITDKSDTSIFLYKRAPVMNGQTWDASIWRFTPDVISPHGFLEGRDYDFGFAHVAKEYHTAYSSLAADTARRFINFNDKNQGLYRWIADVHIDDSGNHIAYFAANPAVKRVSDSVNDRTAVLVYDGNVFAGPLPGAGRIFLSPSGKHIAYTTSAAGSTFFIDGKLIARTSEIMDCIWSPDESHVAFTGIGEHGKAFVVAGGKRSPLYERIGRIGFTADGRAIQYVGIRTNKLLKVRQAF